MLKKGRLEQISERDGRKAMFRCICGVEKVQDYYNVLSGKIISCGCAVVDANFKRRRKTEKSTPEYTCWYDMIRRCHSETSTSYHHYGGRGIYVCERWRDSFGNFLEDMGKRPSKKHSLDRIDNDKGYSPDNCRWATQKIQTANRRAAENTTSKYRGVSLLRKTGKWKVSARADGYNHSYVHVGHFDCEIEAAKAYDSKVVELGLEKIINFPEDYIGVDTNILNKI